MYYVHVQLKLKSVVTSSINLEASQGRPIFSALLNSSYVLRQLPTNNFPFESVSQKTWMPIFLQLSALKQLLSFAEWETVDVFGVWRPEHTQMSKHGLNPAKNVTSFCNWNRHRVSARRGPSYVCLQNNCSCENIFKHLPGAFETKCLPSLDGSWSALSCLPVLPSRNESTNWQWSSPKPDWSPMLWNLPGR